MADRRLVMQEDYDECGCGLWICRECRPPMPAGADERVKELMAMLKRQGYKANESAYRG